MGAKTCYKKNTKFRALISSVHIIFLVPNAFGIDVSWVFNRKGYCLNLIKKLLTYGRYESKSHLRSSWREAPLDIWWDFSCAGCKLQAPTDWQGKFWTAYLKMTKSRTMEHFSRRRSTTIPVSSVSYSVHEGNFFASAVCVSFLKLIYHTAGTVVHLLLLKCFMHEPFAANLKNAIPS